MSETKTNAEVTKEVKSEGGDMKMKSKPKIKKFNATKEEPVKVAEVTPPTLPEPIKDSVWDNPHHHFDPLFTVQVE